MSMFETFLWILGFIVAWNALTFAVRLYLYRRGRRIHRNFWT